LTGVGFARGSRSCQITTVLTTAAPSGTSATAPESTYRACSQLLPGPGSVAVVLRRLNALLWRRRGHCQRLAAGIRTAEGRGEDDALPTSRLVVRTMPGEGPPSLTSRSRPARRRSSKQPRSTMKRSYFSEIGRSGSDVRWARRCRRRKSNSSARPRLCSG
jgi:hypothetical protein